MAFTELLRGGNSHHHLAGQVIFIAVRCFALGIAHINMDYLCGPALSPEVA